ncbi:restriction endonuclease subunit S [Leisingera sp. HS039]|uniref:restriction endonuclease subunit S n=1 Tax=Leisingera sp. HS039 TaxID=2818496 RepID=UPI001B3A4FAE|nr:restriction endonuclease subunit S [Leisingera sp. HS039]MBQ4824320.1 restriction endonuclease subunit S [Leisingera sp. HS039]
MFPNKALSELPLEIIDGDRGANYPKTNEFSARGHCLFLNAGNVSASGFSFSDTAFISEEKDQLLRKGKAQRDDVILTTRGTVGNLALYDESVPYEHVRINSGMVLMRPDKIALDPEFLYYALRSPAFSRQVASLQTGSAQPQLPIRDINHLRIPFPDLSNQKEVSKRVKLIFDKIELNRRMNETLEEMARALFRDWFVDFGPTRRQMEGATDPAAIMGHAFPAGDMPAEVVTGSASGISTTKPLTAATLAPLFPAKLGDDGLPEGWKNSALADRYKITIGRTPPRKEKWHFRSDGRGVPWLSIRDLGSSGAFAFNTAETLEESSVASCRVPVVKAETVLVSFKLTVGRVAIAANSMATNEAIAHLNPTEKSAPTEYTYAWMKQFDYGTLGSTSSIANAVNSKTIRSMPILCPGQALENAYSKVARRILAKVRANTEENQTLAALRDLLLPKLMSGEIRLKDAEACL